MSAPDPESISWVTTAITGVAGAAAAIFAPVIWVNKQLDRKADKTEIARCLGHIEALYKNAEVDRRLTRDLHDSAMKSIHDNQTELIRIVSKQ